MGRGKDQNKTTTKNPSAFSYNFPLEPRESNPQSRQSARLFFQSSELELPHPLTRRRVCSPLLWFGGEGSQLARGRGVGGSQFRRGDRHCDTLGIFVLCDMIADLVMVPVWVKSSGMSLVLRSGQPSSLAMISLSACITVRENLEG